MNLRQRKAKYFLLSRQYISLRGELLTSSEEEFWPANLGLLWSSISYLSGPQHHRDPCCSTNWFLDRYHYRIKVYIECVFLFLLNYKTKYTSQTPTVNNEIYKTHKSTTFDFNIQIVIVIVTQYKMQGPLLCL